MDYCDRSDMEISNQIKFTVASHRAGQPKGESNTLCQDCGDPIPDARRKAAPGCRRCVSCQEAFERNPG